MTNVEVTFLLDGAGIIIDPINPPTLDGIDYLVQGIRHKRFRGMGCGIARDEQPLDQRLSFVASMVRGHAVAHASALFPVEPSFREIVYVRKRLNENRMETTTGAPNTTLGIYRNYVVPYEKIITPAMVGYATLLDGADDPYFFRARRHFRAGLKQIVKHLGKKASVGFGKVVDILVERIDEDFSLVKDGKAMRYLPKGGGRLRRIKPPYWNICDRIETCEIGEEYDIEKE